MNRPGSATAARRNALILVVATGILLVGCSSAPAASPSPSASGQYPGWPGSGTVVANGDLVPLVVNADLAIDTTRVMIDLQDSAGRSLATVDLSLQIALYDLASSTGVPVRNDSGTFRWLIPDTKAIYTAPTSFSHAGVWGIEVTARASGTADRTARTTFSVRQASYTPAIGAPAPASDTLTATDPTAIVAISTDPRPDPNFYALSIPDAIAAGKPFVVVFATPAYCTSGACGPALDLVKQVAAAYVGTVNFIHVEPYLLQVTDGRTQPEVDVLGHPQPIRAVIEWGLPTEPYVFVVDATGTVAAKFEGMAYPDELITALDALLN